MIHLTLFVTHCWSEYLLKGQVLPTNPISVHLDSDHFAHSYYFRTIRFTELKMNVLWLTRLYTFEKYTYFRHQIPSIGFIHNFYVPSGYNTFSRPPSLFSIFAPLDRCMSFSVFCFQIQLDYIYKLRITKKGSKLVCGLAMGDKYIMFAKGSYDISLIQLSTVKVNETNALA